MQIAGVFLSFNRLDILPLQGEIVLSSALAGTPVFQRFLQRVKSSCRGEEFYIRSVKITRFYLYQKEKILIVENTPNPHQTGSYNFFYYIPRLYEIAKPSALVKTVKMNKLRPPLTSVAAPACVADKRAKQRVVFLVSVHIILYCHRKSGRHLDTKVAKTMILYGGDMFLLSLPENRIGCNYIKESKVLGCPVIPKGTFQKNVWTSLFWSLGEQT